MTAPLPSLACDSHMHFYDSRYTTAASTVLRPPDATPAQYHALQESLGSRRVVVVQPTTYGLDNSCQLDGADALRRAAGTTAGAADDPVRLVAVVDSATSDDELARLDALGVRGARFHMLPGGAVGWDELEPTAARIAELDWHIQLQLDGRELSAVEGRLRALPTTLVVDHVGRFMPPVPVDDERFAALVRLVDEGRTWVKLSAPYESSTVGPPSYRDTAALAAALVDRFPERMLWATNWPHPGQSDPPTADDLLELLTRWIPSTHQHAILVDNPAQLYRF